MADDVNSRGRWVERILGTALLIILVIGGWYIWQTWVVPKTVSREPDGDVVSKIVDAKLDATSDLRVSTLTGTVQGTACVDSFWGILHPCRTFKAPFEIDYFVPMGDLSISDFRWNEKAHILSIEAPAINPGKVNIDESKTSYEDISGIWVSSGAFKELRKNGSVLAHAVVEKGARDPDRLRQVRQNARNAIKAQFALPLRAANLRVRVEVAFPDERSQDHEVWDMSTPLAEILAR